MAATDCITAPTYFCKHTAEELRWAFVFDAILQAGDTITSVSSVEVEVVQGEEESISLEVSDETPNAEEITGDKGETYGVGRAVEAIVSGGAAGAVYSVTIHVVTENEPMRVGRWLVEVHG